MSELVQKLAQGDHRVVVKPVADDPIAEIRRRLDTGYIHVLFPDTRGGTELGVHLLRGLSDASQANFEARSGTLSLVGLLKLDYVPVRCVANVDLGTLEGTGRLEVLSEQEYQSSKAASGYEA
jgi:hypothetical protein